MIVDLLDRLRHHVSRDVARHRESADLRCAVPAVGWHADVRADVDANTVLLHGWIVGNWDALGDFSPCPRVGVGALEVILLLGTAVGEFYEQGVLRALQLRSIEDLNDLFAFLT